MKENTVYRSNNVVSDIQMPLDTLIIDEEIEQPATRSENLHTDMEFTNTDPEPHINEPEMFQEQED